MSAVPTIQSLETYILVCLSREPEEALSWELRLALDAAVGVSYAQLSISAITVSACAIFQVTAIQLFC